MTTRRVMRAKYDASGKLGIDRLPEHAAKRVASARQVQNVVPEYSGEVLFVVAAAAAGCMIGLALALLAPFFWEQAMRAAGEYGMSYRAGIPLLTTGVTGLIALFWRMASYDMRLRANETEYEFFPEPGQLSTGSGVRVIEYSSDRTATTTKLPEGAVEALVKLVWENDERFLSQRALSRAGFSGRNNSKARMELIARLERLENWLEGEGDDIALTDHAAARLFWGLDETGRLEHGSAYNRLVLSLGESVTAVKLDGEALVGNVAAGNGEAS